MLEARTSWQAIAKNVPCSYKKSGRRQRKSPDKAMHKTQALRRSWCRMSFAGVKMMVYAIRFAIVSLEKGNGASIVVKVRHAPRNEEHIANPAILWKDSWCP